MPSSSRIARSIRRRSAIPAARSGSRGLALLLRATSSTLPSAPREAAPARTYQRASHARRPSARRRGLCHTPPQSMSAFLNLTHYQTAGPERLFLWPAHARRGNPRPSRLTDRWNARHRGRDPLRRRCGWRASGQQADRGAAGALFRRGESRRGRQGGNRLRSAAVQRHDAARHRRLDENARRQRQRRCHRPRSRRRAADACLASSR